MRNRDVREHKIRRLTGQAIGDFGLIGEGDLILVALSGGKDSWTLADRAGVPPAEGAGWSFSLVAVTVHPGFPGFSTEGIESYLRDQGFEHRIVAAQSTALCWTSSA